MILVDTSVLIGLFKGSDNDAVCSFREVIHQQIPFGISSIIYQEILQGARTRKEYRILQKYLSTQRFFNPKNHLLSYSNAADLYFKCRRNGITIRSTIDCLIAQTALEHDLLLLHNDKDFCAMRSVINLRIFRGSYGQ